MRMMRIETAVQAAQIVSTIGRRVLPKAQITKVRRQIAKKIKRVCHAGKTYSGWYIPTVATMREAKPKLTESVIVQLPMSQIQPVTINPLALSPDMSISPDAHDSISLIPRK